MDTTAKTDKVPEASDGETNPVTAPVKTNLSRLPIILIILGIVETIYFLAQVIYTFVIIIPQVMTLYSQFNAKISSNPYKGVYLLSALVLVSIAEIVYGFWLRKVQKAHGVLPPTHKRITKGIVIVAIFLFFLSPMFLIFSIIAPIYNLQSAPKEVACTQEVKECPDGSYVSRTGPNCAFAPCPTTTSDLTANWKTYTDKQLAYEFKYPPESTIAYPMDLNLKEVVIVHPRQTGLYWSLKLGFVNQTQLETIGATYCDANPQDKRCESLKVGGAKGVIDWDARPGFSEAYVTVSSPKGGVITFNLKPVNKETKQILLKILSTLKFTQ